MAKSAEVDDPSRHAAAGVVEPVRRKKGTVDAFGVPPLVKYTRRAKLTEELRRWYALDDPGRKEEFKRATESRWSIETFVHAARQAWAAGDRDGYIRSFNAFATRSTGLLMSQAVKYNAGEPEDHVQDVHLQTAKEIQAGKAEYAETYFADYAMRKAISAQRHVDTSLESKLERIEPRYAPDEDDGENFEPLDDVAARIPSPEAQAILRTSVGKLEGKLREAFIQYHVLGFTYEEIAEQHAKDESTIRIWVKQAGQLVGHQGGTDEHED